MSMEVNKMV